MTVITGPDRRVTLLVVATLALSTLALLETWITRWPGKDRLDYPIFDRLFVFTDNWGAALEILVVLLVCAVPQLRRAGARLAVTLGENPRTTAAIAFAALSVGARFVYHASPFAMDEYAQLAQAHAFAHGELSWTVRADLIDRMVPPAFRNYFLAVNVSTGREASQYWPGYAALLTPFAWAGVPWMLNPALATMSLLLLHALGVRLLGSREAGGWAMLFALGSAEFTINGISYYSMTAHLALNLLYAWLLLDGRPLRAFLAGLVGGLALILHNPVPHALFAAPWLVFLFHDVRRWRALGAVLAGYVPVGLLVGAAWPLYLGSLVPAQAPPAGHAVAGTVWLLMYSRISSLVSFPDFPLVCARLYATWKIWIWSVPGLMLAAIGGARVVRGPILLFGASAVLTYAFYWLVPLDQGHGWGYRYFFPAWAALPLLASAAIVAQPIDADTRNARREWLGGFALTSLLLATTLRLWQVNAILDEHFGQRIPVPHNGRWAVFVAPHRGLYTWDMIQNMPDDPHRLIMMSFGASRDAALMAAEFPGAQRVLVDSRGSLWSLQDGQAP